MGSGVGGTLGRGVPVTAVFRNTSNTKRESGVGYRWAVSQRGNVNDRDLGISAFKSYSYHRERMEPDHEQSYRRDSGGGFKVGQTPADIKHELTDRYLSTLTDQHIFDPSIIW